MLPPSRTSVPLSEYLRHRNPVLNFAIDQDSKDKSKNNTTVIPLRINYDTILWEDFNYQTLVTMYDGFLKSALDHSFESHDLPPFSQIDEFPFCNLSDEDSLECVLIRSTHPTVSRALCLAQQWWRLSCDNWNHTDIYMARGGQAAILYDDLGKRMQPDWAGVKAKFSDRSRGGAFTCGCRNVLPGDTKISGKWTSEKIESRNKFETSNSSMPLNQLFKYCVCANARYGYLITDRELVVFRFSKPSEKYLVEYRSIPWSLDSPKIIHDERLYDTGLSVNLALWWLHILASINPDIGEGHTELVMEELKQSSAAVGLDIGENYDETAMEELERRKRQVKSGSSPKGKRKPEDVKSERATRSSSKRLRR